MIYILLIIIAVGVLLASDSGKELLGWILGLVVIGGLLYLAFWVFMIGLSFKEEIGPILIVLSIFIVFVVLAYKLEKFKKLPHIEKKLKVIQPLIKKHKILIITSLIIVITIITYIFDIY